MREVRHTGTARQGRRWLAVGVGSALVAGSLAIATAASAAEVTTLTARHSGKVAQVAAGTTDGAALTQNAADAGAANQQWELRDAGGGYVQLVNAATGKCADVTGKSLVDGAALVQWSCGTGTNQQFQLRDAGSGYVNIVARHSGKCV
ncbi:MAG TPA: RICIN domain-containing protein, partial [Catenuloplanes sp.]